MTSPGGTTAASVWVDVLPSMKNFGAQMGKDAARAGATAGGTAGKNFGRAFAMRAAVVAAAAFTAGKVLYEVGQTFDRVTDTIRVGTGATGKALDGLVNDAKNVGRNVPANFDDIGVAVADLNTRLGLSGRPLQAMATRFLNLSRITGTDLQGNIVSITRVFGDWGIKTEDQAAAMDKIFRASQATGIGIDALTQKVVQFGAPLRQMGFSFEQSLAIFGKFEKEGVNIETVMSGLRQGLGRMAKAGEAPAETFKRVTEQIRNAGTTGEANAIALETFGQRAGPDMAAAIREGRFELDDLVNTISNGTDTINSAAKDTMSFAESWQIFKNRALVALEPAAVSLFTALGKGMGWVNDTGIPAVKSFGNALRSVGDWISRNQGWLLPLTVGITAFTLAVNASRIATAAWALVTNGAAIVAGAARAVVFNLQAAMWLLNIAMRANPIGLVLALLTGLVAGLVVAYRNSETFRKIVDGALRAVGAAAKWLWDWFKANWPLLLGIITGPFGLAVVLVIRYWDKITRKTGEALNWITAKFTQATAFVQRIWFNFWNAVFRFFTNITNRIVADVLAWWARVVFRFHQAIAVVKLAWRNFWGNIRDTGRRVLDTVRSLIGTGLNWVRDRFRAIVDAIGRIWAGLRGLLARPINFMINTVWNGGILRAWNRVREWIPGLPEARRLEPIRWAQGGIHEDHRAQLAKPQYRLWAEPETGGEAYIPLAQSKRNRSVAVLHEVADRFGLAVVPNDLATFADGGLWRRMWSIVRGQFPNTTLNSAYRPGDPGYHGSGRAIDIGRPWAAINRWLARNFANSTELIYTPGVNLLHGRPHRYSAATRADHYDHVHWAMANAAMLSGRKGGGFFGWIGDQIRRLVKSITDPLLARMPDPPPQWRGVPKNLMTMFRDKALNFFLGEAGAGAAPGRGPVVDQVRAVARKFGWGAGRQWNALYELIRRESSWNPRAQNPVSTAYGLYQFLNSTWATVGGYKTSNPGLQAEFGNRYIRQSYGNPAAAVAFHDRNNWYDQGGMMPPGWNLAYNGTDRPEPVLTDAQWRDISRAANSEGASRTVNLNMYGDVVDPVDVDMLMQRVGFASRSASF